MAEAVKKTHLHANTLRRWSNLDLLHPILVGPLGDRWFNEKELKPYKGAILTVSEVAKLMAVSTNTIRRWNDKGLLKSVRIGLHDERRFRRKDVNNFIHSHHF